MHGKEGEICGSSPTKWKFNYIFSVLLNASKYLGAIWYLEIEAVTKAIVSEGAPQNSCGEVILPIAPHKIQCHCEQNS